LVARVLAIGGTGFVSSAITERLVGMGHEVILFHRGRTGADLPSQVEHVLGDRRHLADFAGRFENLAPDVVLDTVPMTERDAREVVATFRGMARRVVAISSGDVYRAYGRLLRTEPGPLEPVPLSEDAPLRERLYPYCGEVPREPDDPMRWADDYEKILVERVVMGDPELPGTVLRLPMVYGPGDSQHRLFGYLKRMDYGRPTILLGEGLSRWRWTRGYVENVAAAVALAVSDERAAGRVYNVGETEALTELEWVRHVGEASGWQGEVLAVPEDRLPGHLRMGLNTDQHLVTDTRRIREELGFEEPVSRKEALKRTVAWERENLPEEIDPKLFDYEAEDAVLAEWEREGS
jgi:nucleoside-diphosphate-sugar epimerase